MLMTYMIAMPLRSKLTTILLLVIILLASFLRFYNVPNRLSFSIDQTRDALVAIEGAKELQFPLTGPFSSLGPFTFGPWYYYQLIIFHRLFPIPFSSWIYFGCLSVAFVFIMYKIGKELSGKGLGLLLGLLATLAPPQISIVSDLSNASATSFFAALSVWMFLKLLHKPNYLVAGSLGFSLGLGVNSHYQMIGLLVLPVLFLLVRLRSYRYFLTSCLGAIITLLPLLFFDLNNHWYTLRNLLDYYLYGQYRFYVPNRWLSYLRDFWPSFLSNTLGVTIPWPLAFVLIFCLVVLLFWQRKKLKVAFYLVAAAFLINFVLLRYYRGERTFGYLHFLHPFIFILSGYFFWSVFKLPLGKILGGLLVLIFLFNVFPNSKQRLITNPNTVIIIAQAKSLETRYPAEKFRVYQCNKKDTDKAKGFTAVLSYDGRLSNTGRKIGYMDDQCKYPYDEELLITPVKEYQKFLSTKYPEIVPANSRDISVASESSILQTGWMPISPKTVFDSTVRWWFDEKP